MLTCTKPLKYFTIGQASKLLGLYSHELDELNRTGRGPIYYGAGEYIAYREDDLENWAIYNVHAPILWFDRFKNPDPRTVQRMYIEYIGSYYELRSYYASQLIFEMVAQAGLEKGGVIRLYRPDSPAILSKFIHEQLILH